MWSLKKRAGYGAIVDMHSGSVGVAIVDLGNAESQQPIFSYREDLKVAEEDGGLRIIKNALLEVSRVYTTSGLKALRAHDPHGRVEHALFIYGAPWAHTATRFIKIEDPVPFTVSAEQIKMLVEEADDKDETELKQRETLGKLKMALIERSIVHTALNGYLTPAPYGKQATELSLAHISGLVPEDLLAMAQQTEDQMLPHARQSAHTFAIALFCVVRDLYPETAHGLLLDISGEATELMVMQDEVLIESTVVPCGAHTFLRQVAEELKTMPEEAMMHLREYGKDTPKPVAETIERAIAAYMTCLEDALAILKSKYVLPHSVFLLTNKDLDAFFARVMEKSLEPYYQGKGRFHMLNNILKAQDDKDSHEPYDAFFGIESRFFHKQHGCGEMISE